MWGVFGKDLVFDRICYDILDNEVCESVGCENFGKHVLILAQLARFRSLVSQFLGFLVVGLFQGIALEFLGLVVAGPRVGIGRTPPFSEMRRAYSATVLGARGILHGLLRGRGLRGFRSMSYFAPGLQVRLRGRLGLRSRRF